MKPGGRRYILRVAVPIRAQIQRFGFVLLLVAAFTLMVLGKAEVGTVERFRTSLTDLLAPVLGALSHPVGSVRDMAREANRLAALRTENVRLRDSNARLQRWQTVAHRLERENAALRALLHYRPGPLGAFVSARVIGDSGSAFVRTVLLNAGADDGVKKGRAVINDAGLVGRVVEVGRRASRVLLVTDLNSRVPVVVESTRHRAILAGDNSPMLYLSLLSAKAKIEPGMRIVTSGHGGQLPPGLPIGQVIVAKAGEVRVQPFVDFDRLEYVLVTDWSTPKFEPVARRDSAPGEGIGEAAAAGGESALPPR